MAREAAGTRVPLAVSMIASNSCSFTSAIEDPSPLLFGTSTLSTTTSTDDSIPWKGCSAGALVKLTWHLHSPAEEGPSSWATQSVWFFLKKNLFCCALFCFERGLVF